MSEPTPRNAPPRGGPPRRSPPRALFVQSSLQPPGGGNGVAAWIVEALARDYDVTTLSWDPVDIDDVNRFFGTSLAPDGFRRHTISAALRLGLALIPLPFGMLRRMLMQRAAQAIARDFDVVLTADNEADFGVPGIQYVHYPWMAFPRPPADYRKIHSVRALVELYYTGARRLGRFSTERMRGNLTLVNSAWTRKRVHDLYGIEATIHYPPVAGAFPEVPWEARDDAFLCLGRIAPEKRLELVVSILARVRAMGRAIRLDIVGTPSGNEEYYARIKSLVTRNAEWVTLREDLGRDELAQFTASHRYGIHGMKDEHFGMAVAEMALAGCIVFAPNDGGQIEILDDPRLLYADEEDAVAKILALLAASDAERETLRATLRARAARFSAAAFVERTREIVGDFIARRATGA